MRLNSRDNPHAQFAGPITALTILLKQQTKLSHLFPTMDHITDGIANLLYSDDASTTGLKTNVVAEIYAFSADEAETLSKAFAVASTLTKEQQHTSLAYLNYWLSKELEFLTELGRIIEIDSIIANDLLMAFYANPDTFAGVKPIAIPTPAAPANGEEFYQGVELYPAINLYQGVEFYQRQGTIAPPPTPEPEHRPEPMLALWGTAGEIAPWKVQELAADAMNNDDVVTGYVPKPL